MGCSLIYLRELLEKGDLYGMDRQLDILKDVLSYLKQEKADEPESLKERAKELGVKLLINDNWPDSGPHGVVPAVPRCPTCWRPTTNSTPRALRSSACQSTRRKRPGSRQSDS